MSVSPPPGPGAGMFVIAVGGVFCAMTRKVWPPSTDPNHVLRWVPVPVGPLTNTRPCGSIAMSGSPLVWIGSTTVGVSKPIDEAALTGNDRVGAALATEPRMIAAAGTMTRRETM